MAAEIGVEDGEMVCASKGLHIYDYTFDMAKCVRMKEEGFMFNGE
jgi:thymidylate synthase